MMSTFRYAIEIGDRDREKFERVEAWVDTGVSYTLVPRAVWERLEHTPTHQWPFRLADGCVVDLGSCQVPLRIGDETVFVSCVFGEDEAEALLGATALEELGLGVDLLNHTLVPVVMNLLGFTRE